MTGKKMKLTAQEYNKAMRYLENGDEGDFIRGDSGRTAEVVNMVCGKYLLIDENGFFDGVTKHSIQAVHYIAGGLR